MKIQDALDLHLKEEASRIIGERAIARQFLQKHQQIRRLFLVNFPEKILETALRIRAVQIGQRRQVLLKKSVLHALQRIRRPALKQHELMGGGKRGKILGWGVRHSDYYIIMAWL